MAMSLDGKINNPIAWQNNLGSPEEFDDYIKLLDKVNAVVIGSTTFTHHPNRRRGKTGFCPKAYLLSSRKDWSVEMIANGNIWSILNYKTPQEVVNYLYKQGVNKVLLEGGKVTGWFLEHQLLTKLLVTVCPVIIGDNTAAPLVTVVNPFAMQHVILTLNNSQIAANEVLLEYDVTYTKLPSKTTESPDSIVHSPGSES